MGKDKSSGNLVALKELTEISVISVGLLMLQVILTFIGFSGLAFTTGLYALATVVSNTLTWGTNGIEPRLERPSVMAFLIRIGVNIGLMALGAILWFIVGVIHGIDTTISSSRTPQEILKKMSGDSLPYKVLFALISHITIFSFCRLCLNTYGLFQAMWNNVAPKKGK